MDSDISWQNLRNGSNLFSSGYATLKRYWIAAVLIWIWYNLQTELSDSPWCWAWTWVPVWSWYAGTACCKGREREGYRKVNLRSEWRDLTWCLRQCPFLPHDPWTRLPSPERINIAWILPEREHTVVTRKYSNKRTIVIKISYMEKIKKQDSKEKLKIYIKTLMHVC